jgi:uncharacterized protein YutE (UPF0331/DUF86 family)
VERLLELVVQVSVDIVAHLLAETGAAPSSYRDSFVEAGRRGLVPADLAQRLAAAASLRNILVHMYEQIDYDIIADSIGRAVHDFGHLRDVLAARLKDEP